MIERTVLEWQSLSYSADATDPKAIPDWAADRLAAVAKRSSLGGEEGAKILQHGRTSLRAQQVVGVIAAEGCTLEILPKIDGLGDASHPQALRSELIHMLAVALDLEIASDALTSLGYQKENLLEVLIGLFCDKLFAVVHRGLPRRYVGHEEDLPTLRGRLDVTRQFTTLAASPAKLACRYDALSPDIALNRIMKAAVLRLSRLSRKPANQRKLQELTFAFADVADASVAALRWDDVIIDRTNARWRELLRLARLLLGDRFQTTSRGPGEGFSLVFEMNALFEEYVARMLSRALSGSGLTVHAQGGRLHCLREVLEGDLLGPGRFMTKPDVIVRKAGRAVMVLDTKWKRLSARIDDRKQGVAQADIYQMMAYGRLYGCERLMLLYPHHDGIDGQEGILGRHRIADGPDELSIATIALNERATVRARLAKLVQAIETHADPKDQASFSLAS